MEQDPSNPSTPADQPTPTVESTDTVEVEHQAPLKPEEIENDDQGKRPHIKELLSSKDSPSRYVTFLSMAFAALSLICATLLIVIFIQNRQANKPKVASTELTTPVYEKAIQEPVGFFQITIKSNDPDQKRSEELRVDIVAECSSLDTCNLLKEKITQARDLINPILTSATREEILNLDSKTQIRQRIAEQLTGLVEPGKIEQVHFSDLTIEPGR